MIRWTHVTAMALAFGGAVPVVLVASTDAADPGGRGRTFIGVARRYEWMLWAAAGLLTMTGIGNLVGFGRALPLSATP